MLHIIYCYNYYYDFCPDFWFWGVHIPGHIYLPYMSMTLKTICQNSNSFIPLQLFLCHFSAHYILFNLSLSTCWKSVLFIIYSVIYDFELWYIIFNKIFTYILFRFVSHFHFEFPYFSFFLKKIEHSCMHEDTVFVPILSPPFPSPTFSTSPQPPPLELMTSFFILYYWV